MIILLLIFRYSSIEELFGVSSFKYKYIYMYIIVTLFSSKILIEPKTGEGKKREREIERKKELTRRKGGKKTLKAYKN